MFLLGAAIAACFAGGARASEPRFSPAYVRAQASNAAAASAWLEKTLGWKESGRDAGRVVLSAGALRVVLETGVDVSTAALGLTSQDVDADYAALQAAGAQGVAAPQDKTYGFRVASLRAPGGLVLDLEGPLAGPASGFLYEELAPGVGVSPGSSDTVKVRYVGTLADGSVFARSSESGRPPLFPMASVIPCWSEGLRRMKPGGKARLVCPPSMAYGAKGRPPKIPPGATLTYVIDFIESYH